MASYLRMTLLGLGTVLLLSTTAAARSWHGDRTQSPPEDFRLVILAAADRAGRFDVDDEGRGGLAALHAYASAMRSRLTNGRIGGLVLIHAGNLSGARNPTDLRKALLYPELNLSRYLELDAVGLSAAEIQAFHALSEDPGIRGVPALSFNYRPETANRESSAPLQYRIVRRSSYTTLITALTPGPEPAFAAKPIDGLHLELSRHSGADLSILMARDDTPLLKDDAFWETFFPTTPDSLNPYRIPEDNRFATHWLMITHGAPRNSFERLTEGPYICRLADDAVCEITVEFRRRKIRGVHARFVRLNDPQDPDTWFAPDPLLRRVLKGHQPPTYPEESEEKPEQQDEPRDSHERRDDPPVQGGETHTI